MSRSACLLTLCLALQACPRSPPPPPPPVSEHDAGAPIAPPLDASAVNAAVDASAATAQPVVAAPGGAAVTVIVPREVAGDVVVRVDGRTLAGARGENGAFRAEPVALARGAHLVVVERPACGASASRYVFVQDEGPREFVAAAPSCP